MGLMLNVVVAQGKKAGEVNKTGRSVDVGVLDLRSNPWMQGILAVQVRLDGSVPRFRPVAVGAH
jgi:hypothetical protein